MRAVASEAAAAPIRHTMRVLVAVDTAPRTITTSNSNKEANTLILQCISMTTPRTLTRAHLKLIKDHPDEEEAIEANMDLHRIQLLIN